MENLFLVIDDVKEKIEAWRVDYKEVVVPEERQRDILAVDALTLPAPIKRWDNAIPLGNSSTGGLLRGEGNSLRLLATETLQGTRD